ncbi:MAG: YciI family protein [Rhodospirillales bacterium]|jgi:hypothetical protein|nr:YciI family protein [Rhodospirillales bacterium]MBT4005892.1 YciI family protein [Rhodospirillales bacterium]MBT5077063.1 YciI family protein [Rhodospirillales bacterium]MBT5112587.1 YciI family protein [Rhodospirillales bacterium]MBT5672111.1 YciI family protein [Rhodospirillales bacterium]
MYFAIINIDKPKSLDLRMSTREEHLQYLRDAGDALYIAGPVLMDDGETPMGSLVIIDAENLDAAKEFSKNDPYAKAGLFISSTVTTWRKVFPES